MKRSFAFFALVCAILFGCAATAGAQSKALKKDVKKRVKELTKEGWKPLASSSTLEYAFSKYRTYLETLSKILCKWKQDSVISSFLYLDSVFKDKHKLVHNQAPV